MRPFGVFLAVIGLWPGTTMAMTSHGFLQMHKRTVDNLAPLYRLDDSSGTNSSGAAIPHEYIVMFRPGWTHEQHWAAVGGKDTVVDARDPRFQKASFGYRATIVDDERMHRIRTDPGVLLVENNQRVALVEPVDEHDHHPDWRGSSRPGGCSGASDWLQATHIGIDGFPLCGVDPSLDDITYHRFRCALRN
ncbi:hypothetical protein GE09DRAFT_1066843 [Coniochaeta sp. 2T2.1]|nr:hypothetical protein GE09DRAFT_1066843 [Coniochaeta sp. 2T2.1]